MKQFDFLLAGGGCAGLSMALQLKQYLGQDIRILIVDPELKQTNDRSWAFWTKSDLPAYLQALPYRTWSQISFYNKGFSKTSDAGPYRYHLIRGIDFYQHTQQLLRSYGGVEWLQGSVKRVGQDEAGAFLWVDGQKYSAPYLFDSRPQRGVNRSNTIPSYFLWQHFRGWRIRTASSVFDPDTVHLMDFRTDQHQGTAFVYVLPFSPQEALVEYTVFSPRCFSVEEYDQGIATYLKDILRISDYTVEEVEMGRIPMTNQHIPPAEESHVIRIGGAGNATKPTTGYTFLNIQRQVEAIAQDLAQGKRPRPSFVRTDRFAWYDRLLLHLLTHEGDTGHHIFQQLFAHQSADLIFRFLDEQTTIWQDLQIFSRLPIGQFLRAAWESRARLKPVNRPTAVLRATDL